MVDNSATFGQSFGTQFGGGLSNHTKQLIDDCLIATNVSISNTSYREKVLVMMNHAYLHILQGRTWSFMNRELTFELTQPYLAGTVALNQDSSSVIESVDTDNSAVPVISFNDGIIDQIFTSSDGNAYRILELDSTKGLTLNTDYTGVDVAFATYEILYDRYQMTAHVQDPRSLMIHGFGEIELLGLQQFRNRKQSNPTRKGRPSAATIISYDEKESTLTLEFDPCPDQRYTATLEYSTKPVRLEDSETSFPLIPSDHVPAIFYATLAEVYRLQNNPAMATDAGRKAAMAFNKLASDREMTDPVARIQHKRKYFNRGRQKKGYYGLKWFGRVDD